MQRGPITSDATGAFVLRHMTEADIEAVLHWERELFGAEAWTRPIIEAELRASRADAPDRSYVVVEHDGEFAGYAGLWFGDGGGTADLLTIATTPAARGRGYARMMLRHLLTLAEDAGCADVLLEVRESNVVAQALYRSEGFEAVGRRRRYYLAPPEDAVVMRRELREGVGPVGSEVL